MYVISPQTEEARPNIHIEHCAHGYYEQRDAVNFNHFYPLHEAEVLTAAKTATNQVDLPHRLRNPNPIHDSPNERKVRGKKQKLPPPADLSGLRQIAGMPSDKVGIKKSGQLNAGDGLTSQHRLPTAA